VSSSKAAYDQASNGANQIGSRLILLNRLLERYGPETAVIRSRMRAGVAANIEHLWPTKGSAPNLAGIEQATGLDEVHDLVARLEPKDEMQRVLRSNALNTCADLAQSRWLIIEQAQTTLPIPFLAMLIFWLTVLFVSLGLLAPRNATISCSLFVCALSMAGAIYLILEMNRPLEGAVQISPAPLHKALSVIGQSEERLPVGKSAEKQ
jgi:hypothetical protein